MASTRTASTAGQEPEPPMAATTRVRARGQGHGRGRGRDRARPRARAAPPTVEPQVDFDGEVPAQVVHVGPTQVPEGFIATPVLSDALVRLVGIMERVAQIGTFPVAPAVSRAGGGAQTPATYTLEQVGPQFLTPAALPVREVQPVVMAQAGDRPALSSEAMLRLDKFTKLFLVHFSGASSKDLQDFLDHCHEVLRNMGIVETNGVDFVVFQCAA
uniref:Uncharacterized protein n=1 Tax=Nicotiana tabacum TaxID=4097 RepID=A0A1S4D307_TOBAC|nr:PREDICTED: uncharacterized protein LOC107825378 [Nicotiana tabacum]XP_016507714.1 PREDICTED: uncharacterized protein LOC107825378 [Nicotiana tabacum]